MNKFLKLLAIATIAGVTVVNAADEFQGSGVALDQSNYWYLAGLVAVAGGAFWGGKKALRILGV